MQYGKRGKKGYDNDCNQGLIGAKITLWLGAARDPHLKELFESKQKQLTLEEQED